MKQAQFDKLKQQNFNRIPLVYECLADFDTPLSVYNKLNNHPYTFLLESVEGGEQWGRHSIIGLSAQEIIRVTGHKIILCNNKGEILEKAWRDDPFTWIAEYKNRFRVAKIPGLPRFSGGLMGYFSYDCVRYFEKRLGECKLPDPTATPDILLMLSEELVVFDNLSKKIFIIVLANAEQESAYSKAKQRLWEIAALIEKPLSKSIKENLEHKNINENNFTSNISMDKYLNAISRIKQYIIDGDVMQVVFSQRLKIPYHKDSLDLYRALRYLNPSPYLYHVKLDDFAIVGSSPEILVRLKENEMTVRPLAGTRPRGKTEAEDLALEKELLADPKELAEHLMLIDLGRNDVGRVCEVGSVKLTQKMVIERYSHVMHISSNVVGKLKKGLTPFDALHAALPAGTLSGAPKIRAMEIIDELENVKRGIYGGAIGYIGFDDEMDMAITIRTAIIKHNELYIQAGGGIVADSNPEEEWHETMRKARAIFKAVALSENGFIISE